MFLLTIPLINMGRVTGKTERQTASWLKSARAVKISPALNISVSSPLYRPARKKILRIVIYIREGLELETYHTLGFDPPPLPHKCDIS